MRLLFLIPLAFLVACKDDETAQNLPDALALTEDAAGHYCQMVILEHEGPKAQVHLDGYPAPLWFSQVRDGLAYILSPEQSAEILVLYVNDMGVAKSWAEPGADNWINANDAFYVVGSDVVGGMGAPEITPFGALAQANEFVSIHGGNVMQLNEISVETVLSPVEFDLSALENSQ